MRFHLSVMLGFLVSFPAAANADPHCPVLEELVIQMNATTSNIANAETTRTEAGGPYRRKDAFCDERGCEITESAQFRLVFLPDHPDANSDGYVALPKINVMTEMAHLVGLQSTYDQAAIACRKI